MPSRSLPPEQRGRVVGGVMAGLLTGILLSRTVSGAIGAALGWRAVYLIAAGAMAVLAVVLRVAMPRCEPEVRMKWGDDPAVARDGARLRAHTAAARARRRVRDGCLQLCSGRCWRFTSQVLGHGSAVAGMFGAIGVVGIFVAPVAGRLAVGPAPSRINIGRARRRRLLSFAVFLLGSRSLIALGDRRRAPRCRSAGESPHEPDGDLRSRPELRNRLNALYMVSYFAGGALGTFVGSLAWSMSGWPAVCTAGAAFSGLGDAPAAAREDERPVRTTSAKRVVRHRARLRDAALLEEHDAFAEDLCVLGLMGDEDGGDALAGELLADLAEELRLHRGVEAR